MSQPERVYTEEVPPVVQTHMEQQIASMIADSEGIDTGAYDNTGAAIDQLGKDILLAVLTKFCPHLIAGQTTPHR